MCTWGGRREEPREEPCEGTARSVTTAACERGVLSLTDRARVTMLYNAGCSVVRNGAVFGVLRVHLLQRHP